MSKRLLIACLIPSRNALCTCVLVVGHTVMFVSSLRAQQADADLLTERLRQASARNWYLRVTLNDSSQVSGRLRRVTAERATLGNHVVELNFVSAVQRRIHIGRKTTGATVLGAVLGAVLIAPAAVGYGGPAGDISSLVIVLAGAGVGAIFGTAAGHAIAPGEERWVEVWPHPDER